MCPRILRDHNVPVGNGEFEKDKVLEVIPMSRMVSVAIPCKQQSEFDI